MCADGSMIVDDSSPGQLASKAALLPDPYPRWAPPAVTEESGKVRCCFCVRVCVRTLLFGWFCTICLKLVVLFFGC
jgi:hypothetical protein